MLNGGRNETFCVKYTLNEEKYGSLNTRNLIYKGHREMGLVLALRWALIQTCHIW